MPVVESAPPPTLPRRTIESFKLLGWKHMYVNVAPNAQGDALIGNLYFYRWPLIP